ILHLVRVATGLDSLVVGEEQILGQLRSSLRLAHEHETSIAPLDGVVSRVLEAGRRIRTRTMLGRRPSLASAAVFAIQGVPELPATGLAGLQSTVLGAGAMARSAAQALVAAGSRVSIVNRTLEHAERLAIELGHTARSDRKSTRLNSSHLVISYAILCPPPASTLFPYTTLFRSPFRECPSCPPPAWPACSRRCWAQEPWLARRPRRWLPPDRVSASSIVRLNTRSDWPSNLATPLDQIGRAHV